MDIDRNHIEGQESGSNSAPTGGKEQVKDSTSKKMHHTEVDNAHASGLGSMGRSDEKLNDKDKRPGKNDVVY